MDFGLSDEQKELQGLAKQILRDHTGPADLRAVEAGDGLHVGLWAALGEAGLLGLGFDEDVGGLGMGDFTDICLLLEQVGRHVAPVPIFESIVLGALPVARWGTPDQRAAAGLDAVLAGRGFLTSGLLGVGAADPMQPSLRAVPAGDGWALTGTLVAAPHASRAARVLVSATVADSVAVFLVDPGADGVTVRSGRGTHDLPVESVDLNGVSVGVSDVLGGIEAGPEVLRWVADRAHAGLTALALGVAGKALHLTAKYVSEREQFGVPLATFQAVSQRAGDAWIDVESMRLVLQRASWLLAHEREAAREVAVARIVAADAAHRVACSAIHLHGGMGFDRDYPLYRYFLWTKHLEFLLGPGAAHVARLGDRLAEDAKARA